MSNEITAQRVARTIERLGQNFAREDIKTVYGRYRYYAVDNALVRWNTRNGAKRQDLIPAALDEFIQEMEESSKSAVQRSGTAAGYQAVYRSLSRLRDKTKAK